MVDFALTVTLRHLIRDWGWGHPGSDELLSELWGPPIGNQRSAEQGGTVTL